MTVRVLPACYREEPEQEHACPVEWIHDGRCAGCAVSQEAWAEQHRAGSDPRDWRVRLHWWLRWTNPQFGGRSQ